MQLRPLALVPFALASLPSLLQAQAQGPVFRTPGLPRINSGQTDQFTNDFNPAFGLVLDSFGTFTDVDGGDSGLDFFVRAFEITFNAYADPRLWTYAVVVAEPEEGEFGVEEAAAMWIGWDSNATLRAGRFFVDFGKQMQAHVHDLSTFDRPLVLSAYLGEELAGTGIQYDNWWAVSDETAIRFSLGVFDSLLGEGEEEDGEALPTAAVPGLQDPDELAPHITPDRLHRCRRLGHAPIRRILARRPEFSLTLDSSGATRDGLSNHVFGVDLTYGFRDESGLAGWTFGGEWLLYDGDIGAEILDAGTPGDDSDDGIDVTDDSVSGFYVFADREFSQNHSVGALFSQAEMPGPGTPTESRATVYYTRNLSEFTRLRFGVRYLDSDLGNDERPSWSSSPTSSAPTPTA